MSAAAAVAFGLLGLIILIVALLEFTSRRKSPCGHYTLYVHKGVQISPDTTLYRVTCTDCGAVLYDEHF